MAEVTSKVDKVAKLADPIESSIDPATQEMLRRAQRLNVETVFDRAVTMKPCAIGLQGIVNRDSEQKIYVMNSRCKDNHGGWKTGPHDMAAGIDHDDVGIQPCDVRNLFEDFW